MTLDELTPWLFARTTGGIRWGLERTEELLAGAGDPHRRFRSLLIGGTNGKGSVAALCDGALRATGQLRVGLYTSPHLVSFAERVRVDGAPVEDEVLADAARRLRPAIESTGASFFEATTAMAFLIFAELGVDLAVVEVGLGGRLDATNVLMPLATAITNIARDHEEYLGSDLEGIAREKAGIFKRSVPALVAEADPEIRTVLTDCARSAGAQSVELDRVCAIDGVRMEVDATTFRLVSQHWGARTVVVPMAGRHQARNAAIAAELLALLPAELRPEWDALISGFASTRWPGRLQLARIRGQIYLLDVAHNPAGANTLAEAIDSLSLPSPVVLVVAILSDKDWRQMLKPLVERSDAVIVTQAESAPAGRRWDPREVGDWCRTELNTPAREIPELSTALSRASTLAPHGTVVVTGSFHTVGDAMRVLHVPST